MAEAEGKLPDPIDIQDVIRAERRFLGLSDTINPDIYTAASGADAQSIAGDEVDPGNANASPPSADADEPWALCLSGGGIRSATFGLGVLQGLAEVRALTRFHYLSTVSGGGYIGSWLSRWIHEEQGDLDRVQDALDGHAAAPSPSGGPRQVRSLRAYSNYLSPVWGLSTDFFTLVSIFFRNLLLNWLVLLPLLFAVVLLPRLYVGITAGSAPAPSWEWTLIGAAGLLIVIGLAYVVADLPSDKRPLPEPRDRFPLFCFLPIAGAAALLGIVIGWHDSVLREADRFPQYVIAGVVLHVLGCVAGMIWRKVRKIGERPKSERHPRLAFLTDAALLALSGAAGGALVYALAVWLPNVVPALREPALHALVTAPVLLLAFWLATTLYVALVKYWTSEGDREWWSRSGAWWLRFSLCWLLGFSLVICVPELIAEALDGKEKSVAAAGGLWGIAVAAIGYWTKNGAKITDRAQTVAGAIGLRLLDLAAIVFIVAVLIAFCFAIDFAVRIHPKPSRRCRRFAAKEWQRSLRPRSKGRTRGRPRTRSRSARPLRKRTAPRTSPGARPMPAA